MSGSGASLVTLRSLLDHAAGTTQFYQPYAGDLDDFPVVDKAAYKQAYSAFQSSDYVEAQLHERKTSGSTGTPFSVGQDPRKRHRAIADLIYFNELAGQRLGDRLMRFRTSRSLPMSRPKRLMQNIAFVDHVSMNDDVMDEVVRMLRREDINCILAFSSKLWLLARYIERRGYTSDEFGLGAIISVSETLQPDVKRRIEMAFGCPVSDRYANEENGVFASTRPGTDLLVLNRASYRFEFLKLHDDEPEAIGNVARVVITDLYNYAMPMIRYDTGDLAIVGEEINGEATAVQSIEGRRADVIYDTVGREVTAAAVSAIMAARFLDISQFQLVQEDAAAFDLRVSLGEADYHQDDFPAALAELLGADAQISVEFLESIPSGPTEKYRAVICNYVPDAAPAGRAGVTSH